MPLTPHIEHHFTGSAIVRDLVIGMADGLTVPFALAAGLSGAVDSTSIVVTAGLAEIAAGSIAMGLGGYLAARSDVEHYEAERVREETEVREKPDVESSEVADIFRRYGLTTEELTPIVEALRTRPQAWVDFMMRFELGLEKPDPRRALASAATIALAYIAGGFIPLGPYMVLGAARGAAGLGRHHPARADDLRLREGPVHRCAAGAQRAPDDGDWRCGRGRGLRDRQGHFLKRHGMNVFDWQQRARDAIDVGRIPPFSLKGRGRAASAGRARSCSCLLALYSTYYQVNADEVGVVQRFGRYVRTTDPGAPRRRSRSSRRVTRVPGAAPAEDGVRLPHDGVGRAVAVRAERRRPGPSR